MNQSNGNQSGAPKETTIEAGTKFKGSIDSDCRIVVNGTLEGEITGPELHVSETGTVCGTVKVKEIHSSGVLEGEFEAETVSLAGEVKDKTVIRARTVDVKLEAASSGIELVFGDCELEVGDVQTAEEAVNDAIAASAEESSDEGSAEKEPGASTDDWTASEDLAKAEKSSDTASPPN